MKKTYLRLIFTSTMLLFITACASTNYNVQRIKGDSLQKNDKISFSGSTFYLVNGGDGKKMSILSLGDSDEVAVGSGDAALNIANEYLLKYSAGVVMEKTSVLEDRALEIGTLNNSDYLIFSRVEEWSDPLGINCSGHYYDEASVLLSLYSIEKKELINTTRLSAKSCPSKLNGIPLTTGSPEDLYETLFIKWMDTNFQTPIK